MVLGQIVLCQPHWDDVPCVCMGLGGGVGADGCGGG